MILGKKYGWIIVLASLTVSGCTTFTQSINSNPPNAVIYWGKQTNSIKKTKFTTPYNQEVTGIIGDEWEGWCYKVAKEGYDDSDIICMPKQTKRVVSFELTKIGTPQNETSITKNVQQPKSNTAAESKVTNDIAALQEKNIQKPLEDLEIQVLEDNSNSTNYYDLNIPDAVQVFIMARKLINSGKGKQAVKPLIQLLRSPTGRTRINAIQYLGAIGADAAEALPDLEIISKNDKLMIARYANSAISKIKAGQDMKNNVLGNNR